MQTFLTGHSLMIFDAVTFSKLLAPQVLVLKINSWNGKLMLGLLWAGGKFLVLFLSGQKCLPVLETHFKKNKWTKDTLQSFLHPWVPELREA